MSRTDIAYELKVNNLLKALELKDQGLGPKVHEHGAEILDYVIDQEIRSLQFDVALFPQLKDKEEHTSIWSK